MREIPSCQPLIVRANYHNAFFKIISHYLKAGKHQGKKLKEIMPLKTLLRMTANGKSHVNVIKFCILNIFLNLLLTKMPNVCKNVTLNSIYIAQNLIQYVAKYNVYNLLVDYNVV